MEKVFDAHVHYRFDIPIDETIEIFKQEFAVTETTKYVFLSLPHELDKDKSVYTDDTQNIKGLFLKHAFGKDAYAFAGLIHPQDYSNRQQVAESFLKQVQTFWQVGYDGIKMLEGYPQLIKARNIGIDDGVFDLFYDYCQTNGIPITMHIANPDENWDITKASKYAIEQGRVYDGSYPTKAQITQQMFNVMEKFPRLRLTLAHCGFFSTCYQDACKFMSYPNTVLDITPGGEQLINMSHDWQRWLEFFTKYQDRIIYGSDYYAFPKDDNWQVAFTRRPTFIRQFFETSTKHMYLDDEFCGVDFPSEMRHKLYMTNSERLLGASKPVDYDYVKGEAHRLLAEKHHYSDNAQYDLQYILNNLDR